MRSAEARNAALGASTSQAQDSAVAEVGRSGGAGDERSMDAGRADALID
jgi:hypothetical protein